MSCELVGHYPVCVEAVGTFWLVVGGRGKMKMLSLSVGIIYLLFILIGCRK